MNLSGAIVGQYHIIEQVSRGSMATVYKAYQPNLDRYVAVKVLTHDLAEAKGFIARFEREAKAVARLRHRNILTVFDYGRQGDLFYLVMEYVSGGTLIERLGWPQDLAYAVNIVSQVGDALAHAHMQGMIHRDVKPGNILMAEEDWPLLSDFGLAKMVEDSPKLTASGASVGTPQYMSPEQAQGLTVDRRSDIYSLGAVLYETVTGRPPFGTDAPMAVILRHINEPTTPPHALRSDLPEEIEHVILKALAKSPADRYQRMEEFLADLQEAYPLPANHNMVHRGNGQAALKGPPAAFGAAPTPLVTPHLPRRRSFPWTGVAIGIVLLLTLGLTLLLFKASMVPLVSSPTVAFATVPSPSAAAPSPTAALPSPTVVLPSPTVAPTMPATQTIKVRVWEADGAEMVFVPAGEFVMGSENLGDDERPAHRVYLDDFWIDRYEVTNERFALFVTATGYQTEAERRGWGWVWKGSDGSTELTTGWEKIEGADWRHPRGPDPSTTLRQDSEPALSSSKGQRSSIADKMDHPVVLVSWNDADTYCRWAGKRLPSEAQWEKAARGPSPPQQARDDEGPGHGRCYAWGDEFDSAKANTSESKRGDTTPVGSFSPQGDSPYGASDMTGNVWEWVADWYGSDYYSQAPLTNPPGPITGTYKVLRGGSWPFDEVYARTPFRYNVKPEYTYDFVGFRCSSQ
jgi:formylglycine-generating enzyme required for sulfatase activity/tRNA A-37 threonylcarbamoyl transferase component Bud32